MKIKAIIPCCGFGTRMNMPIDKSKELLLDSTGKPLIEYHLDICKANDLEPLIITRKEKKDLIEYCTNNNIGHIVIEPGKEWPHTVFNSSSYWNDKNILLLPDTRFEPLNAIAEVKKSLEFGVEISFAVHKVDNLSKWGFVNAYMYCEKPRVYMPGYAWGIIGFTKKAGENLFWDMREAGVSYGHNYPTNFIFLDNFVDITRTGKIE